MAEFHLKFRFQSAEHFFAPLRIHCRQFGQEFVARSLLRVTTQPDADGQKGGRCPHGNVTLGNHEESRKAKVEIMNLTKAEMSFKN